MDKTSIVSSQAALEMPSFSMDTCSVSSSPLVNSLVKNWLFRTASYIDEPPFQVIHTMHLSVRGEHDAAWQPRSHNPWLRSGLFGGLRLGARKFGASWRSSSCTLHVRGAVRRCMALSCWNTKLSRLTRHSAYRWQQHDVIMTSWSSTEEVIKIYHQNFLFCNNNEIIACIADLLNSVCEEVYAVAFFNVVQQHTVGLGEVGNSVISLCADYSVCNSERIVKIGQ